MVEEWASAQPQIAWNCEYCEHPTTLAVLERWWVSPQDGDEFDPFERLLAKCTECSMPYVLGRDADFHGEESHLEQVFPESEQPLAWHIPKAIRDSHDEAVRCKRAGCYTAATIMSRRGVEAICVDHGQTRGTLYKKLENLLAHGTIDQRLMDWSSVVRDLGNEGAHDVAKSLTREDAEDAISFFEALVNYLYTFKRRYEEYLERRGPNRS